MGGSLLLKGLSGWHLLLEIANTQTLGFLIEYAYDSSIYRIPGGDLPQ
jgi:hypothetical protein